MARAGRLRGGWVLGALGTLAALACGGNNARPLGDGSVGLGDALNPMRRTQMLTAETNSRGIARVGSKAEDYADLFLIDAETQKPISGAWIEALPEEAGENGYFVRVSKEGDGYRPELVRVARGQQRTVPLAASTPDVPGRAVRLSQPVYDVDFLGEGDLASVTVLAKEAGRPEIVFSPVLEASAMMASRFNVYRSSLPGTVLALRVEGTRPADGSAVRSRARVVSTSGLRRTGLDVLPAQVATAAQKGEGDDAVTPIVSALVVGNPDAEGKTNVTWQVDDRDNRVLAFEVGVDTTLPGQRVAAGLRNLPITVRQGEHYVCVRPVFPGADLDSQIRCQPFDAAAAPGAANLRVRVRAAAAGTAAPVRRQPMPVDIEVENLGTVDAPAFDVDVVLSRDGRSEGGLGEVRSLHVDGVRAGSMAVRRTEITPPRDGSLYVVARADSSRALVESNSEDNLDRRAVEVMPGGQNHSPVLSVAGTAVAGGGRLLRGQPLRLQAVARDLENGDLTTRITWVSSRDGQLGGGGSLDTSTLTPGRHRVRAQVSDQGIAGALRLPDSIPLWRRLFDPPPPATWIAVEPPETVAAEFDIEVVEPELARAAQSPPVVSAGPDLTTTVGVGVMPRATAQDPDGDTLSYAWTARDESGNPVAVEDAAELQARFVPEGAGHYRLELTVSDGQQQEKDQLDVFALAPSQNQAPEVALTWPETGVVGQPVRAEVTASDPEGDGLTLTYSLTTPEGSAAVLLDAETRAPALVPDLPGVYRLTVVADDGRGRTGQAEASTHISAPLPTPDGGVDANEPDGPPSVDDGPTEVGPEAGPVVPQPNGATCGGRTGCQSGHCVDGICCDTPCFGLCSTCSRSDQVGTCLPVASGQDPRDDCPSSATCDGQGSCQPIAVRPGTELLAGGADVELAGDSYYRAGDPEEEDRSPAACDRVSGHCAFLKMVQSQQGPFEANLFAFDGRAPGPLTHVLVASHVSPYTQAAASGRLGFIRGTLLYATTSGEVWGWRPGWSASHRLASAGSTCVVSPDGAYAACLGNRRPAGETGQLYDLQVGPHSDGGDLLPTLRTFYQDVNDRYSDPPAFSPDSRWLAIAARADAASLPTILLQPIPAGPTPVTVLAEANLDTHLQFSPDSSWLAFMRGVTQAGEESGTLAVADVSATPTVRNIVVQANGFGWWRAPGGTSQIVYLDGVVNELGRISKITDLVNPTPTLLVDKVAPYNIVFAPAVARMGIVRDGDNDQQYELSVLDLASGTLTELARNMSFNAEGSAAFSANGDSLAWSAYQQAGNVLYLSGAAAGAGAPLLLGAQPMRIEFTPAGTLVFTTGGAYSTGTGGTGPRAAAIGPSTSSTLRVYDGRSYPPRVLQPGVRDGFVTLDEYVFFVISGQGSSDGLYRVRLGASPPPVSCDPLQQSGCAAGSGCFLRGPGDVTACATAGSGGLQADCSGDDACAPGFQCGNGQCWQICASGGAACPSETPFCRTAPGNARLGLCLPPPPPSACDPVRLTGCFTPPATTCQVQSDGIHQCGAAGAGLENDVCQQNADCGAGLGCFSDTGGTLCRRYCDSRGSGCGAQNLGCRPLPSTWVGYCIPVSPPQVCEPVLQTGCALPTDACYIVGPGATTCMQPGPGAAGALCGVHSDCAAGLGCFDGPDGRICRAFCDTRDNTCPSQTPNCLWIQEPFGICAGSFSPGPDGGTGTGPVTPDAGVP